MSETVSPPGPVGVILLLARVALRRWLNRAWSSAAHSTSAAASRWSLDEK